MDAAERHRVLEQYQGMSLSQIDAGTLAGLPWSVQVELIATLPHSRQAQHQQQQAEAEAAAAQRAPLPQARQARQQEQSCSPREQPVQQEEQETPAQPEPDSDSDDRQHSRSGSERAEGTEAGAGAGRQQGAPVQAQRRQQDASTGVEHWGSSTPIESLPSLSQVDHTVLDALPLHLKREIERAYGIGVSSRAATAAAGGKRGRGGGGSRGASKQGGLAGQLARKKQRLEAFVAVRQPPRAAPEAQSGGQPTGQHGITEQHHPQGPLLQQGQQQQKQLQPLTLSQVDQAVLEELPPEVWAEVVRQLQPFPARKRPRQVGRSRLGEEQQQHRWEEAELRQQAERRQQQQQDGEIEDEGGSGGRSDGEAAGSRQHQGEELLPGPVSAFLQATACSPRPSAKGMAASLGRCLEELAGLAAVASSSTAAGACQGGLPVIQDGCPPSHGAMASMPHSHGHGGRTCRPAGQGQGDEDAHADLPPTQPASLGCSGPLSSADQQAGGRSTDQQQQAEMLAAGPVVGASLASLTLRLRQAAGALVAADLEHLRKLLQAVRWLGRQHSWFAAAAGEVVDQAQLRVEARYGWRLKLARLLQEE